MMAYDFLSLDLNIGEHCHKGVNNPAANSIELSPTNDTILDNAIFEFFKEEKIKNLKRKFNILDMKDLSNLKERKMICIDETDCNKSDQVPFPGDFVNELKSKISCSYGHILSPQLQEEVLSCFKSFCVGSSSDEICKYQSLILSIINLLCNFEPEKDDVQTTLPNAENFYHHKESLSQDVFNHVKLQEPSMKHNLGSKARNAGSKNFSLQKGPISEAQKKFNSKVSFIDLNESCYASPPKSLSKIDPVYTSHPDTMKQSTDTFRTPHCIITENPPKSPEVVCVGERKFIDKMKTMCNKSDDWYNENLVCLRQSYRRAKIGISEAHEHNTGDGSDKFVVVDEHYGSHENNLSPQTVIDKYSLSKKFPVSKYELIFYLSACKLATIHPCHDQYAADIGGVHVKFCSLGQSLAPGGKVGSFVMNIICRKFFLDERPTISLKHYFFSSVGDALMRDSSDFSYVKKCFDGAASVVPLRSAKMLLFPICHSDHWFLFVVDLKKKYFFFLDSFYSQQDEFQLSVRKKLVPRFLRAWDECVGSADFFRSFKIAYPYVPRQNQNSPDCGIFVIKFLELFTFDVDMLEEFSQVDIRNIRVQIVNELLLSEHNVADISIVKECTQDALARGWKNCKEPIDA